ncbi:MAG: SprT-like domain-containing protein [Paludibacteraceae bacterium]|nr:SprT-like domain-containing protein [Paludibacteraceae bacterium]
MIPTVDYIQSCFDEYNVLFFNGTLPPIPIKLSNARTFLGKVTFVKRRKWLFGEWVYSNFKLRINTRFDLPEELIQDTILHEMIHYYIAVNHLRDTSTHGQLFRREMKRINEQGNRHITISYRLTALSQLMESSQNPALPKAGVE